MEKNISLESESLELEIEDCSRLNIDLKNSASLTLRIANFSNDENIKINAELGSN